MAWILLICSHIVALLDIRAVRLISSNIPTRKRILIALLFLDFLPFTWMGISLLFWRDNPTWMTPISMWLQFLYMNLVIARGPALLLYVVSRNRVIHTLGIILSISIIALYHYSYIAPLQLAPTIKSNTSHCIANDSPSLLMATALCKYRTYISEQWSTQRASFSR